MYKRDISQRILDLSGKYAVVTVTGSRQAGKTTLVKFLFPEYRYFSLENPEIRELALADPMQFLAQNDNRLILDEVQNAPALFSYIQGIVDTDRNAKYILSGSQNFLLLETISQSLAGRVAVVHLHPLTWAEMKDHGIGADEALPLIWRGTYPGIFDKDLQPAEFYPFYINTYLERDVRTLRNPMDPGQFQRFLRLLAGRAGQIINYADLARDAGVSPKTAKAWVYVLEQSHLIFLLQPYYRNFNKRLIKSPKLYFIDTGLLCHLLRIHAPDQLLTHYHYGAIFENAILAEYFKMKDHLGLSYDLYFWRDNHGNEIDLLIETGNVLTPVEIKSVHTLRKDFMKPVRWMEDLLGTHGAGFVIYGGAENLDMGTYRFVSWEEYRGRGWYEGATQ